MMKVRLLNNGGYGGMGAVDFPVEVEAFYDEGVDDASAIYVPNSELLRVGANEVYYHEKSESYFVDDEFEVIE